MLLAREVLTQVPPEGQDKPGGESSPGDVSEALADRYLRRLAAMDSFFVGPARYPLRERVCGLFDARQGLFLVPEFGGRFVGHGATAEAARSDWERRVHETFQGLLARRGFPLTEADRKDWEVLEYMIDVERYRAPSARKDA